jgi:hypothetical protein
MQERSVPISSRRDREGALKTEGKDVPRNMLIHSQEKQIEKNVDFSLIYSASL